MTNREALSRATARLASAGVDEAEADAEVLLRHATGLSRADLFARAGEPLPEDSEGTFLALVEERAARRPLQHLTGTRGFWKHEFKVTPDVLIPRRETEILVEAALELVRSRPDATIVDVGTGSGCIALSLAAEAEAATVHATDVSPKALAVAKENAARLGLGDRVTFHEGDLLDPMEALFGTIDIVLSNPPYVDLKDRDGLQPEVRDHEPSLALFAPGEALSIFRRLLPQSARALRPGGRLLVEVGQGQADEVSRIATAASLHPEHTLRDLASIPRVVVARRGESL